MSNAATLPRRPYADTGFELSVVGLGGIVVKDMEQDRANRLVAEAVERGVNYFDVAPTYGNAQDVLGPALEPYREGVFLACKTNKRDRAGAEADFEGSCKALRTDRFDLYQLHGITQVERDVEAVFQPGGVMDFLLERQKAGQIGHIGFSAHSHEAALAAFERYDFKSALFPVNFACWMANDFGREIFEACVRKGAARLSLKALARERWPEDDPNRQTYSKCWYKPLTDPRYQELAVRWTLSQDLTAIVPPGEEVLWRRALDIAQDFAPISVDEEQELAELARNVTPIFPTA